MNRQDERFRVRLRLASVKAIAHHFSTGISISASRSAAWADGRDVTRPYRKPIASSRSSVFIRVHQRFREKPENGLAGDDQPLHQERGDETVGEVGLVSVAAGADGLEQIEEIAGEGH